MHREWADRVRFLLVYVREAHAADEWETADNVKAGISVVQPRTEAGRRAAATEMCGSLEITFPAVLDGVDDAVSLAYGAWPDRLYVVDEAGIVVHKSAVGPFGFRPEEVRAILAARWGPGAGPAR